jgi:hypothetical protein
LLRTFLDALTLGAAIKAITGQSISSHAAAGARSDRHGRQPAVLFALAYEITRYAVWAKRRLLWRVRRR